jgi:dihydroneopterin aldolase
MMRTPATIRIRRAVFFAHHGVTAGEREVGRQFEVDLECTIDATRAVQSDALADTVNYEAVYRAVERAVIGSSFHLLERLAGAIESDLFTEFAALETLRVTVRKPAAPVPGVVESIEVELAATRAEWEARKGR